MGGAQDARSGALLQKLINRGVSMLLACDTVKAWGIVSDSGVPKLSSQGDCFYLPVRFRRLQYVPALEDSGNGK